MQRAVVSPSRFRGARFYRSGLAALLVVGALGIASGSTLLGASAAGANTKPVARGGQVETVKPYKNVKTKPTKVKKATKAAAAPGYTPLTALINEDTVSTDDGITDSSGDPISLEQYALQQLGYTVTVDPGTVWDSLTAAQFAQYQLLVVGDPFCGFTPTTATSDASTWAPVVLGNAGGATTVGNRVVIGTDPEFHYLEGDGGAQPTDPSNPMTGGAEHMVEDGLHFAGAVTGATGVYFDTSCEDAGSDVATLDQLTTVSGGSWTEDTSPPCGGSVSQIASNPAFDSGPTVMTDTDIEGWGCSDHITFPTFPTDFDALAVATDTATAPTCGTDPDSSLTECGEAYILLAGEDVVSTAPNLSLAPPTGSDPAGGTHTVTATVTQGSPAAPVAGAVVSFAVSGQNSGVTGTCTTGSGGADPTCATDANGLVKFTYSDTNGAGSDTIGASVTLSGSTEHATATEDWTAAIPPTTTSTSLSGGGKSGASISVPTATAVTDSATLAGTNSATAGGSVTYTVYSNSTCTTSAGSGGTVTVTGGVVPTSSAVTLSSAGKYYWQASYTGDANNGPSVSTCGSEVETVTSSAAPTTVTTSLSGGGDAGGSISVPTGTAVTDSATLAGTDAATAGGSVTYTVYSNSTCTTSAGSGGTVTVTGGVVPASSAVTLSSAGKYYWQASYTGDATNEPSVSTCGSEVETVTSSTVPPTCVLTSVINGPPKEITVTVQAAAGLSSVNVTEDVNDTVTVPPFTSGDTSPLVVSAVKQDQSKVSELALKVTDNNGVSTSCDPADFSLTGGAAQSATNLDAGEHFVTITNDGLTKVAISVDGVTKTVRLTPDELDTINLSALFAQATNNVVVKGTGPGSADVLFAD